MKSWSAPREGPALQPQANRQNISNFKSMSGELPCPLGMSLTFRYIKIYLDISLTNQGKPHMRFGYEGHHERRFGPRKHGKFGHGHHPRFRRSWMEDQDGGRRRLFDSGELRLVLLKLISDQPRHGYDLIRAIEELTGGAYAPSPGVVYPALSVLQDLGHIEGAEAESSRKAFS